MDCDSSYYFSYNDIQSHGAAIIDNHIKKGYKGSYNAESNVSGNYNSSLITESAKKSENHIIYKSDYNPGTDGADKHQHLIGKWLCICHLNTLEKNPEAFGPWSI